MLPRDLLRFRIRQGEVTPLLLGSTPAVQELAEAILAHWRAGVGQIRGDLEDGVVLILHRSRALAIGRGLNKIAVDHCRFLEAEAVEDLRTRALAASAARMVAPAPDPAAHRAMVAAELTLTPAALAEQLYADLPDRARLAAGPDLTVAHLIERYNLGLCQGLLLSARSLQVRIDDPDVALRRSLVRRLRFHRLLAEVRVDAAKVLHLDISGPGSVLDQATRYGVQLANFLPALCCAKAWSAKAEVAVSDRPGGSRVRANLTLGPGLGLVADRAVLAWVPPELRELGQSLGERLPEGWTVGDAPLSITKAGELVVPDLRVTTPTGVIDVECFHRWHAGALARRLKQIAAGELPRLALGVERALARSTEGKDLVTAPAFAQHGFLFTDIPVARPLREAVERLQAG